MAERLKEGLDGVGRTGIPPTNRFGYFFPKDSGMGVGKWDISDQKKVLRFKLRLI